MLAMVITANHYTSVAHIQPGLKEGSEKMYKVEMSGSPSPNFTKWSSPSLVLRQ